MNSPQLTAVVAACVAATASLCAEDEVTGLRETAERFVKAYNDKDLDALRLLYVDDAVMIDEIEESVREGVDEIAEIFSESFESFPDKQVALEVGSVRLVSDDVAMEDGIARFSSGENGEIDESIAYCATLVRNEEGDWKIAVARELRSVDDDTPDPGSALEVLDWLPGEWTMQEEGLRLDVEIGWDVDGNFLVGEAVSKASTGEEMVTSLRIGYDGASDLIRWWTFDGAGGFAFGEWTRVGENAWEIVDRGVTSSGERNGSTKTLTYDGENSVSWISRDRVLDGESLPDLEMTLVRRPPAPALPLTGTTPDP